MNILGFQKLTTLDYPDTVAAIVFTYGCNFLCPFCHNPLLVLPKNTTQDTAEAISESEILAYLEKRKAVLQGLCISGGEPLLQTDIVAFIEKVKNIGLKVKLDTNGCYPEKLKILVEKNLIDYVAMDIKNSPEGYPSTVGIPSFDVSPVLKTADFLKNSKVDYEFRVTLVKELHGANDLKSMGQHFGGKGTTLYLQNFVRADSIVNDFTVTQSSLTSFSSDELIEAQQLLSEYFGSVIIRGI